VKGGVGLAVARPGAGGVGAVASSDEVKLARSRGRARQLGEALIDTLHLERCAPDVMSEVLDLYLDEEVPAEAGDTADAVGEDENAMVRLLAQKLINRLGLQDLVRDAPDDVPSNGAGGGIVDDALECSATASITAEQLTSCPSIEPIKVPRSGSIPPDGGLFERLRARFDKMGLGRSSPRTLPSNGKGLETDVSGDCAVPGVVTFSRAAAEAARKAAQAKKPAAAAAVGGGTSSKRKAADDSDPEEELSKYSEDEDGGDGETPTPSDSWKPQTQEQTDMCDMFRRFCGLSKPDAAALVMVYRVDSPRALSEYKKQHWEDAFNRWQQKHENPDKSERRLVLTPPMQDKIKAAAWFCRHAYRLHFRSTDWDIDMLQPDLFDSIYARLTYEESRMITLDTVKDVKGLPKIGPKETNTMARLFRAFESFLWDRTGPSGFPLSYVLRKMLYVNKWSGPDGPLTVDIKDMTGVARLCYHRAPIVPTELNAELNPGQTGALHKIEEYESGKYKSRRTQSFRTDEAIVLELAKIAFKNTPVETQLRTGQNQNKSGRQALRVIKGMFVSPEAARIECDEAREGMKKQFKDETLHEWHLHTSRWLQHKQTLEEWAQEGQASHITDQDYISQFLATIPADCKCKPLVNAKQIVESDRAGRFVHLEGTVVPYLTSQIPKRDTKRERLVSEVGSDRSGKRQKGGKGKAGSSDKDRVQVKDGKVVGTLKGTHYPPDVWNAMNQDQRQQVLALRKAKKAGANVSSVSKENSALKAELKKLKRQVKAAKSKSKDGGEDAIMEESNSSYDDEDKKPSAAGGGGRR
jgi:hypothetical protein